MLRTYNLSHYEVTFYPVLQDTDTVMEIDVDTQYLRAEIAYGKLVRLMWRQKKYVQIKRTLVHEVSHILLQPLWKPNKQNMEQTTEHVSRLLYKLL